MSGARYDREQEPPSYEHLFHAGNIGDVWKHCALLCCVRELLRDPRPLTVLDCHAGRGVYDLQPTGEWTEGVGQLLDGLHGESAPSLQDYLRAVEASGFDGRERRSYPGSPRLLRSLLRANDRLLCWELQEEAAAALQRAVGGDPRIEVRCGDGLAGLAAQASAGDERLFALVDPPWVAKQDWQNVPAACFSAWRKNPALSLLLWYPIKSYTRVAAMQRQLEQQGLPNTAVDLITMPLQYQRKRLNGSGVALVNAAPSVVAGLLEAAPAIGRACAIRPGEWHVRATAWEGRARA